VSADGLERRVFRDGRIDLPPRRGCSFQEFALCLQIAWSWSGLSRRPGGVTATAEYEKSRGHQESGTAYLPSFRTNCYSTTVTDSWPRPRWFDKRLCGRRSSKASIDIDYREKSLDAGTLRQRSGSADLDIVINGDCHLGESLNGLSWLLYQPNACRASPAMRPFPPAKNGHLGSARFEIR
jgi:hypothetical protein